MRALVTGGGGFLGRYIVEQLLERGDEVTVFARGSYPEVGALGARLIRGNIRDREALTRACEGVDVVFHVAAKAGVWGPWEEFYAVNVTGTENVIAACRERGVPRLVYTSSPSVIFDGQPHEGVDESYPYPDRYECPYPETKAIGERRVIEANGSDGLLTCSLRPHLIFGPRDSHLLPALVSRARKGLPQVGDGTNRVSLTYVEDAARAHLLAADALETGTPVAGSCYFITQGEPVVLWTWINELLAALDLPPTRYTIPLGVARSAGAILELAYRLFALEGEPRMTRFLASELAHDHYYDISAARRDFGYEPQYTMEEARAKTVAWLKEQMN
jgi:nucleoside-diphosphate-sugar epimerase